MGLVSFGPSDCGRKELNYYFKFFNQIFGLIPFLGKKDHPGVYTAIMDYLDWVLKNLY